MKTEANPLIERSQFITPKGLTYTDTSPEVRMRDIVVTIEQLTAELEALHRRLMELEKSEAERDDVEQLTAAAYGLPTGSGSRKDITFPQH